MAISLALSGLVIDNDRALQETMTNPYAPPATPPEPPAELPTSSDDRDRYLARAAKIYRWMGWIGLIYFGIIYPIGLWSELSESPVSLGAVIGMTVTTAGFAFLFSQMIRLSRRMHTGLESAYSKIRWVGLLAGAFSFPLLTFPAFYAVWLVGRARGLANDEEIVERQTEGEG
ncbi:hypothetical protein [Planctomycetes bacterium TBK1r]|uniref:DUF4234 domain-containing protein n=1 Tax=Stieleria magnilauensis TaxID=2527963 RepID=A0ABX5XWD3_9BACT|nr:hypothetical protein TBK1r_53030 [Planctomycetes bacterium TBK1r]